MKKHFIEHDSSHELKKWTKVVNIQILFFFLGLGLLAANTSYSQEKRLSLNLKNESVLNVLSKIEEKTKYNFLYGENILDPNQKVTIHVEEKSVEEVLSMVLRQHTHFKILDDQIILYKDKKELDKILQQQEIKQIKKKLTGVVTDQKGDPLIGVSIKATVGQSGTATNFDGSYSIDVSPETILEISYIGFVTQKIKVGDQTVLNIKLQEDDLMINEVVVIGYGTVKKSDLTGSVSTIKVEDIESVPAIRVDQMLQGRIAGAEIVSSTGEPGANTSIRIRGTRSITANNEPLYVVDGIMNAINDLNDLNPGDIESIEVLKDASSTAIYGSRGSNGVIIISTKKGREGSRSNFTFRTDIGFSQLPRFLDLMNASEFAQLQNDRYYIENVSNQNKPIEAYPYPDPLSLGEGTNWTKEVTRTAPYHNITLSASGGDKSTKYYYSAGYSNNQGIIINSGLQRYQTRLNLDKTLSKYVQAGFKVSYTYIDQELNNAEVGNVDYWYRNTLFLTPLMAAYKEDGSYNDWNPLQYEGQIFDSPLAMAKLKKNDLERKTLNIITYIEVEPIKDLKLRSHFSFYDYNRNGDIFIPEEMPTRKNKESGAYAYKSSLTDNNILNENTITYKKTWNDKHNFDALYGFTFQSFWMKNMTESGEGYFIDGLETNDMGALPSKETVSLSSRREKQTKLSNFVRFNYNYNNKYYVTFTTRADGASNFSRDRKWGYFPSAALKWNISKEGLIKSIKAISDLSLRLSAGISGNDAIPRYQSLSALKSSTSGYIFNEAIPVSYIPDRIENNRLTWEKTTAYNLGIDMAFLRNRLRMTTELYTAETKDLLLTVQYPTHTGYPSRIANIGRTSNKGVEVTIDSRNIETNNFSWSTTFTIAHNKQMVKDIGGYERVSAYSTTHGSFYPMYAYQKGYPLNAVWGMQYAGTWKSQQEIDDNKVSKKYASASTAYYSPGRQRYIDQNNDGNLDNDDLVYLGNSDPDVYGGLQNSFKIFGFKADIYFNYSLGGKLYNPIELFMGTGSRFTNQFKYMVNAWHPVRNPNSDYPRANSKDQIPNDRFVHDASFLRLKNISLSYTFDLLKATRKTLKSLTLTLSGNNVYLWKKYNGFDPEVSSMSEGSTIRRMDNGAYPNSRTFVFSTSLIF